MLDRDPAVHSWVHSGDINLPFEVRQISKSHETEDVVSAFRPHVVVMASNWFYEKSKRDESFRHPEAISLLRKLDRDLPVIVLVDGAVDASQQAIELLRQGATDCIAKPFFAPSLTSKINAALEVRRQLRTPSISLEKSNHPSVGEFVIGKCEAMLAAYQAIGIAAASSWAVLIRGESGTGKSLAANLIHFHRSQPGKLQVVRCRELTKEVLEDLLFDGKSLRIDGAATWILEDVNLASIAIQRLILDWIRTRKASESELAAASSQSIVMTSCDSPADRRGVPNGMYADLFYELRGSAVSMPLLRDRGGDLELLVDHFVSQFTGSSSLEGGLNQRIAPEALQWLRSYSWPGNVTELRSVVIHCLKQSSGVLTASDLLYRLTRPIQALPSTRVSEPGVFDAAATSCTADLAARLPAQRSSGTTLPHHLLRSPDYWESTVEEMVERAVKDSVDGPENGDTVNEASTHPSDSMASAYVEAVEAVETGLISAVLRRTGGNLAQSARLLGMSRVSLRKKIHSLGLVIPGRGITT